MRGLAFSLALAWAELARADLRPSYGGAAQAALPSSPIGLDPLSFAPGDADAAALVFDTLFRVDAGGKPRPHLAISIENSNGTARVRLRGDVKFHDGSVVRAGDVAASLSRALRVPGGWTLGPVKAVRAVGDDLVELELSRPTPELPLLLSTPAAAVLPGGTPRARPVGSGPFSVEKIDRGAIHLRAFAGHFAGRPYLDRLVLRAFTSRTEEAGGYEVGALQASRHGVAAFEGGSPKLPALVVDGPVAITSFVALGRSLPEALVQPLQTALTFGVDRDRLRRLVGAPAVPAAWGAPPTLGGTSLRPTLDIARARAAIEPALAGKRARLGLLVDGSRLEDRALADRLLADLARLGIDLTVEVVDAPVYQWRMENGRYELALGAALPPAPEAGLAALALQAAVDPAAARAQLQKGVVDATRAPIEIPRVVPLVHRAARLHHVPSLRGLAVDAAGRVSWADVHAGTARRQIP